MTVVPIRRDVTLGGSEIPAVLGLDPYVSPYALACRKLGVTDEPDESPAAVLGLALEDVHRRLLVEDGYTVIETNGAAVQHPEHDWLVGHPDALVVLDGERAPVELKARGVSPSDAVRLRDTVQALVYAELCASSQALVSVLHGGYGGIVRDEWLVERDPELWPLIVERCEQFLDTVRRGKAPAPDGSDSARDAIRARYQGDADVRVRADKQTMRLMDRLRELDETIRAAKAQRERIAQQVQDYMGDAVELVTPHDTVCARWTPYEQRRVDTAALRKNLPHIAEEYTKAIPSRRFTVE